MKTRLKQLNILDDAETETLLNYADMDKKGFLNFSDFSSKLRPNMIWDNKGGELRTCNFT